MNRVLMLLVLLFLSSACGAQPASVAPSATDEPVEVALPAATSTVSAPPNPAPGWVEYRDARYGYGLALPCYWIVTPTPSEGDFGVMVARSYTDEFFAAHSTRGVWNDDLWPAGAVKLDALVAEGLDPALGLRDAVLQYHSLYSSEQQITSLEDVQFNGQPALLASIVEGQQGVEAARVAYFLLRPGVLMSMFFQPAASLQSEDARAILNSFAPVADQAVVIPSTAPAGPPDGGPVVCP